MVPRPDARGERSRAAMEQGREDARVARLTSSAPATAPSTPASRPTSRAASRSIAPAGAARATCGDATRSTSSIAAGSASAAWRCVSSGASSAGRARTSWRSSPAACHDARCCDDWECASRDSSRSETTEAPQRLLLAFRLRSLKSLRFTAG